jgi:sigma-B regulation protein RsbU (phosphoserine phosphatase)
MPKPTALSKTSTRVLHIALAVIAFISISYQARALEQAFPQWFGVKIVQWPFLLEARELPHFLVQYVGSDALAAGLENQDEIIAINGVPLTSRSVYSDILLASHAGQRLTVTYRKKPESSDETAQFPLLEKNTPPDLIPILYYAALPAFCMTLGFLVAVLRPKDVRAWLLLGLMLSMATFFNTFPDFWNSPLRMPGAIYLRFQQNSWLAYLLLLGIYFPEPFPDSSLWRWWHRLASVVLAFWAVFCAADVASFAIEIRSIAAAVPINRFSALAGAFNVVLVNLMIASFLASIALKYRLASSIDNKRRLRVLYAGAAASLLPITTLYLFEHLEVVSEQYIPYWIKTFVYLAFFLLPVTLAYVIVVQRAMDVRILLRTGSKYLLASTTLKFFRIAGIAALLWFVALPLFSHHHDPVTATFWGAVLLLSAILFFDKSAPTDLLQEWVDRRFFREAYDTDLVLNELSEQVRSFTETGPLVETVARRISEVLHVPWVSVLLRVDNGFQLCYSTGAMGTCELSLPAESRSVRHVLETNRPVVMYQESTAGWLTQAELPERVSLDQLHAEVLLALPGRKRLLGIMVLGSKRSEAPYSVSDLRVLQSVGNQTGLALEVSELAHSLVEEASQRAGMNREMEIARGVQQRLFPRRTPHIQGLDLAGACLPALGVGGDYYDYLTLPNGMTGLAIGDIAGKGIAAALLMAGLQASLRGLTLAGVSDLSDLMAKLNTLVYDATPTNRFATFFYCVFDPGNRSLHYSSAGHNPMLLYRKKEKNMIRLRTSGLALGLRRTSTYVADKIVLELGDELFLYTDGVTESRNSSGEEFDEVRLEHAVRTSAGKSADETLASLLATVESFAAGEAQHDDITLIVARAVAVVI